MVRETRHLWVGNLPDNIREDRIRDHFKRYGRVQSVKLLGGRTEKDEVCATVSFMDIKSAAKAHHSEQKLDERALTTEYHEPAAIPAPNYSRFHLGSEELSGSFDRSSHFYDREGAGGYIRRSGSYHSAAEPLSRNRARDRASYRNGPYTPIIESVVSRSGGSSSHRTGTWTYDSPSPRYPPSTPDISYPEPAPIVVHKKHSKSRSGSDSGSNSSRSRSSSASSQSGSSTCSTASSSPASEKSCSTHHSQQSNIRSSGAQSSTNHTNSNSPAVHSEDRRPLAICVRNLPARSSDTSLKDGLYHEYKKHGKVTWVKVVGQGVDRYALVSFKKPEDVDKALQVSHDKLFFGCKIEVAPYQGYDVDDNEFRPFEAEQDEFHPKATRTLFIGNLDKDITTQEIRKHFDQFGEIIDIDIKKQGTSSSYAFCQFSDIGSVVRAMRSLDGEHVGGNRVKLGFGKSMHTSCVWVDGVAESVSEKYLSQQFGQFGPVSHVVIDRARGQALVSYEQITYAQQAVKEMRGAVLRGRKLQVDYASRECQESFYDHMDKQSNTTTSHPPFENSSSSVAGSPQNLRVFESPSSSSAAPISGSASAVPVRYNSCSRYSASRSTNYARSTSPTRSRHSTTRFQEYPSSTPSGQEYERRPSYRSYEDMTQVEDNNNPNPGTGDIRHLQKERVSLLEQLEDCTSSGEEGTNRRRCNKHRRSQSGESSRPGTPLCDERPENLGPVEPRRPRESRPPDPLSLPLPRFASQVLSPRPAPPSPPASPQTHSSSSDSEPSPEWEERLRSLDEKYEKWSSGSRAGPTKVDLSTHKVRHKLLELDLHELQPSEIVKSVLAKRSVFDEDSKRLENFGEKYEPREFVPARSSLLRGRLDLSPMSSPIVKSPSSPAAKGLQYPFPSHPPVQPTTSVATTSVPVSTTVTVAMTDVKPTATTFLTNCTTARQFPLPKISSPQAEKSEANLRLTCTKVLSSVTPVAKPSVLSAKSLLDLKKEQPHPPPSILTKIKSSFPNRRESSDDKKEESRRKSRDESVDSVKSMESVKREDTSECDKVKDAQITERRKSVSEKRRNSTEQKDSICDRTKDTSDKRRASSEIDSETTRKNENKKIFEENHIEMPKLLSDPDKIRKVVNDNSERRKETESNIRPSGDQEKKKDVFGVNSEKDRRRNKESVETLDNLRHNKKVPDIKKEIDSVDKEEEVKIVELDKKKDKDISEQSSNHHINRHKERKDHQDRRRDSSEHTEKKSDRISPETPEVHRIKDKKMNHDLSEPRNSKKQHEENEVKIETIKHKDSDKRKNSENEISKEHSLFKKVFGFAERTYGHHKDRRDSDCTAVKTDDNIKHRRDHSEKERKRDKDSDHSESSSKHKSRKSPDQPENNRHKERKHSESSEKRIRKEYDQSDDLKQKNDHPESLRSKSRERKEDRISKDSSKSLYTSDIISEINSFVKHNDRRKDCSLDESRNSESDSNDLKLIKDGDIFKKEGEVSLERRKEDNAEVRSKLSNDRRKDSTEKCFDNDKYTDRIKRDESDIDKKIDLSSEIVKYKHERHRDGDRKKEQNIVENFRNKDQQKDENRQRDEVTKHKEERKSESDLFDCLKPKDENYRYRDYTRKKDCDSQEHIRTAEKKKEEKKKERGEREPHDGIFKVKESESEEKCGERDIEKIKRTKEFDLSEGKVNGDDEYTLENIDCRKPSYDEEHNIKKEKRKDRTTWPATIGCKRRLSSQDSLEMVDDAKRSKPERRDSKDSGRSSGSSRKSSSEKHKGFTKLLEEKIKEDKEREQRKKDDLLMIENSLQCEDKMLKPAVRKEKRNSGEKRKEERKFKSRPRENGTASESDMYSGDEEAKAIKRQQHSIFDIVDDEPAYISMYDKVKARSTKNMQKLEEEKRQEKLKEKFHQLKASRAKREEKKRSTSYDEDSDSEKGGSRRSNKLLITSSEDDACSEADVRVRARKILCDTSEDDTIATPRSRLNKYSDYESKSSRKIISDVSEDDSILKHSTPKIKSSRNISFESDIKTRKIMSDTSEDDSTRQTTPRQKPSRIQSDESEGDLGFEDSIRPEPISVEPAIKITDVFVSRPVEMNHFTSNDHEQKSHQLQSSPETLRRVSMDSASSEQHRKKSHKKKTKKRNYEVSEDGTIIVRKHSSKKEKKKSHRDEDDEKKSRKKKSERESSSNKREEKLEDIFGPLSDDSEKAAMSKWQVSQVYGSDSESERENIRKKEKKRREKKLREQLDEAGRALEAKLLDTSQDITEEPIKTKKKKRKKSRDEKMKHHRSIDESRLPPLFSASVEQDSVPEFKKSESESVKESEPEVKKVAEKEIKIEKEDEEIKMETDSEDTINKDETTIGRQISSSLSCILDSPPAQLTPPKKLDIPGFGSELDETIHENAVKSISETTLEDSPVPQEKYDVKPKQEDVAAADKPTPVISQEETEDAVAALLMEDAFGSGFERYSDEAPTKSETPVSEPDLQIDTDSDDPFADPKSPDATDISFSQNNDTREGLEERIMSLACSTEPPLKEPEKTVKSPNSNSKRDSDKRDMDITESEKTPEKLAVVRTPEKVGLIKTPEKLAVIKTPEKLAVVKTSEKLAVIRTPEKLAVIRTPEKLAVVRTAIVESDKSEDSIKTNCKEQIPVILNEGKPIEIDDDDDVVMSNMSNKIDTSGFISKTENSIESLQMPDIDKNNEELQNSNTIIDNITNPSPVSEATQSSQPENQQTGLSPKSEKEKFNQLPSEPSQNHHQQLSKPQQPQQQLQKTPQPLTQLQPPQQQLQKSQLPQQQLQQPQQQLQKPQQPQMQLQKPQQTQLQRPHQPPPQTQLQKPQQSQPQSQLLKAQQSPTQLQMSHQSQTQLPKPQPSQALLKPQYQSQQQLLTQHQVQEQIPPKHQPLQTLHQAHEQIQTHQGKHLQNQHQSQQQLQNQHQTHTQHPALHHLQNQHQTQQQLQNQHQSQKQVQNQHQPMQLLQNQHQAQNQHHLLNQHQIQQQLINHHQTQQNLQNQHQLLNQHHTQQKQFQHQQLLLKQHQQINSQQQVLHPQQVIKSTLPEKTTEPPNSTALSTATNFQKSEKILHQQTLPPHHNSVLVHQSPAQIVKPLSVQVINSTVIKPLDQSYVKQNQSPLKLNSPPGVVTTSSSHPTTASQANPSNQPVTKPLHHMQSFQGRMPKPLVHLVPPHLAVKPTAPLTLQAPQLTPLAKAGLATSPRPLHVSTIQSGASQKQLHVVTQNLHHSPQPVSPQNLKMIRPVQSPNPNPRQLISQQQQQLPTPVRPQNTVIPLLQTVSTGEAKQYHIRPPQVVPNPHLLHLPIEAPHPEKVMNLSPSLPIQNSLVALAQKSANNPSTIKTNETVGKPVVSLENNIDKQNNIPNFEKNPDAVQETKPVVQVSKLQINSCEPPICDVPSLIKNLNVEEVQKIRSPLMETKLTKPNIDETKPLNAVIQDLTIRGSGKSLGKVLSTASNPVADTNLETRPIDQVVKELQQRKKTVCLPSDVESPASPLPEVKIKEEIVNTNEIKQEINASGSEESLMTVQKAPGAVAADIKKPEECVKVEVKEEEPKVEALAPLQKEDSKVVKEEVPKAESEQNAPDNPEPKTPKSLHDSLPDHHPASEERVIPSEKSLPLSGTGRGRGGRRRKMGRGGATGVVTRRGGRTATATISPTAPQRPQAPADVYEFRDDSEEERPRLILTIKSEQPSQNSSSQVPSTRKSRRLQEKDGTRTMIDDTVEDSPVSRGPGRPSRRATRSSVPVLSTVVVEATRKSPRRKQAAAAQQTQPVAAQQTQPVADRSPMRQPLLSPPASNTVQDTPSVRLASPQPQPPAPAQKQMEAEVAVVQTPQQLVQKEPKPPQATPVLHSPQPAPVLHHSQPLPLQVPMAAKLIQKQQPLAKPEIKVGPIMHHMPPPSTTLIDPVTGLLIPMRECEEGQYIPVAGGDGDSPPEKRLRLDEGVSKAPIAAIRPSVVRLPQQPQHTIPKPASPPQLPQKPVVNSTIPRPPKAHILQAVAADRAKIMPRPRPKLVPPQTLPIQAPKPPTPMTPKAHILQAIGNAQAREGVIGAPAPHQGSILTGSVASPPLRVHPQPIVTGASSARFVVKDPGRLSSDGSCIVVPPASPQPPPRGQVMQAGLPVPAYEASLHGVVAELLPNPQWPRQQSPPPAHQHTAQAQAQGEVVQHVSNYGHHIQPAHYVHPQLVYQQFLREAALGQSQYHRGPGGVKDVDEPVVQASPPLELRRRTSPHDRTTDSPQVATLYGRAHLYPPPAHRPAPITRHQVATPPHASQVPPQGDSLLVLLQRYPVMWQGLLALKNDQAAVQMHFVYGNPHVARDSLPCNSDGSTPPLRISQRMRLEQTQLDGVARKMQMENEHCMLLALPCGRDHMDVLKQSNNLRNGFITYLQQKQAAGIVNIAGPGSHQAAYVVHIFPASDFANDSLERIAPDLLHRVEDIAHLLIVIATV